MYPGSQWPSRDSSPEFHTPSAALPSTHPKLHPRDSCQYYSFVLEPFLPDPLGTSSQTSICFKIAWGAYLKCRSPEFIPRDSNYGHLGWGPGPSCNLSKPQITLKQEVSDAPALRNLLYSASPRLSVPSSFPWQSSINT